MAKSQVGFCLFRFSLYIPPLVILFFVYISILLIFDVGIYIVHEVLDLFSVCWQAFLFPVYFLF